jgi:trimeric autotransporter adhesin
LFHFAQKGQLMPMLIAKVSRLKLIPYMLIACALQLVIASRPVSATTPRIVSPVDESRLTKLPGNVSALARAQYDQGEAASSTQLTHIRLVLSRSSEQEAALDKYLVELQDKSSENYQKWLTPEQFGALYGPADSDIAALVAWLESHGLKLETVAKGRTNIAFSGTVSQVEEAFHTQIHSFAAKGQQFYSNTSSPSIPAALAPVVKGVAHLSTFLPEPHLARGRTGKFDAQSKRLVPASAVRMNEPKANFTLGSGTAADPYTLYLVPGDAATIYDTPNTTFNANYTSGANYTGSGVTIGIGGANLILGATVSDYRNRFLGSTYATAPTITNVDGAVAGGATDEAYTDNELAGGIAPGAALHFYTSTDLYSAINQAINDNTVDIFSLSFGQCEMYLATADNAQFNTWWQQAATQGIAVTVSTGDSGSAGCDATQDSNGDNVPTAVNGLQVSGFASTPYNIAVGGTDFYPLIDSFSTYVGTTAKSGGTPSDLYRSALSYIPESTWNDSSQTDTTISANSPITGPGANIVGGGGGKSSCSTNTDVDLPNGYVNVGTCTSGYLKPSWQRGAGVPNDNVRDLPDVSLMAGNGADAAVWLVCTDDTGTDSSNEPITANCTDQTDGSFYFLGIGGTSTSAPTFAGILALVEQKTGKRLGQAAKGLYDLYNSSQASAVFHDVAMGNNSVPCDGGTPDCAENTAGNYYETGYDTTAGYDLATGLGSVDAKQLIAYWGTVIGSTATTVTVTPSASSVNAAQSLNVVVAVTGASGAPTGTVTLSTSSYVSPAQTLVSGGYTFTVPAGTLAVGTDTLTITYSGDKTYATNTGTATVIVTAPTVTFSPTSLIFPSTTVGASAPVQTVTLTNTGTASLSITGISITGTNFSQFSVSTTIPAGSTACSTTASVAAGASCVIAVVFAPTAAGSFTATVSVADNAAGSPQTVNLAGTGAATAPAGTYKLTASTPAAIAPGASATSTITATPSGGYTGTITLTCSVAAISGGTDTPTCSGSPIAITSAAATGTVTVTTTGPSAAARRGNGGLAQLRTKGWIGAGGAALAGILLLGIPARRRNWRSLLAILIFVSAMGTIVGCGGSSSTVSQPLPGTTAGAYTVTVTGTDTASNVQTTTFVVTVN